jgi:glycosyltransferase involved in cell wall biosynthesis
MSDTVTVIIATIGKPTLRRAVESVLNQTHKNVRCMVVVDGEGYEMDAGDAIYGKYGLDNKHWDMKRIDTLQLPQNTGANGYRCFRIYGAIPFLVNTDWIAYLDDDNWFEPEHIANCVEACKSGPLDWCFTLRNIWHNDKLLCPDHCESVGLWPAWHDPAQRHIDTNCFFMRREMAVAVGPHWHRSRFDDKGIVQVSADTVVANVLMNDEPRHALIAKPTVNYELGSWDLSPKPEFFLRGNKEFLKQHGGKLPWESSE